MNDIKMPFSPFDVFANIIPPSIFIVCLYRLGHYSVFITNFIYNGSHFVENIKISSVPWIHQGYLVLFLLSMLFCFGHTFMAAGSLIIDRILVGHGYGYPYVRLLKLNRSGWKIFSGRFYKTLSLLFFVYVIGLTWYPNVRILEFAVTHIALFCAVKICFTEMREYCRRNPRFSTIATSILINPPYYLYRIIYIFSLGLTYMAESLFNLVCTVFRIVPYDDLFIEKFAAIFKERYGIDIVEAEDIDSSVFWLPYSEIHETRKNTSNAIGTIRSMLYFSRSLSIAFGLLSYLCVFVSIKEGYKFEVSVFGSICIGLSVVFFIHYYNIYFNYYTKQTLRAFYSFIKSGCAVVSGTQKITA